MPTTVYTLPRIAIETRQIVVAPLVVQTLNLFFKKDFASIPASWFG